MVESPLFLPLPHFNPKLWGLHDRRTACSGAPAICWQLFAKLQNIGVQVTVEVSQGLVVCTFSGQITDEDVVRSGSLIHSHPDFDPSFSEIVDCSAITGISVSTSVIQDVSLRESYFNLNSAHVVIAPQDLSFGLARMAQVFAEKTKPNIFVVRSMEEAREILRLPRTGSD